MEKKYHLPVIGNEQYKNPFCYGKDTQIHTNPDPYIIKYEGKYYCYSSGNAGVNVSVSENLSDWTYLGLAAREDGKHEFWAPCVIYDNGTFYMYCANTPANVDDCHQEFLQLYESSTPEGPFTYVKTFFQKFSIDAHVVKDIDGEVYMFYSVNDYMGTDEYHSGTVILVDRLIDYTELAHEEQVVVAPSIREEVFEENRFGDGRDWHTIEGAFFFRHHRRAYVMYAANAYIRENYFLGYSAADARKKISEMEWNKFPDNDTFEPLIRRNEKVEGTGHNSVIKAPNLVDDWVIYHGREQEQELILGTEQREGRIDPLLYSGDRLISNAPSYLAQDMPEKPKFQTWDGEKSLHFVKYGTAGTPMWVYEETLENYIMEADIRCNLTHMGGRYGLLLAWTDEKNYLELVIDSGKRFLAVNQICNQICIRKGDTKIPAAYNHEVSHNLKVIRTCSRFQVLLDEVPILTCEAHVPYGKVGFFTKYTDARYPFFAVTEHVDLFEEGLCFLPYFMESSMPGVYEKNRITYHCPGSTELKELEEAEAYTKTLELELRSAKSQARILLLSGEHALACVQVENEKITIYEIHGKEKILKEETTFTDKRFTVYFKEKNGKIMIFADGASVLLEEKELAAQHLEMQLQQVDICGYSCTKLSK